MPPVELSDCNVDTIGPSAAEPMCVGRTACLPAILVSMPEGVHAVFAGADTGLVTVVSLGRPDDLKRLETEAGKT